jgi:polyvinyl alcohol dehydrogenase (cytochrome)
MDTGPRLPILAWKGSEGREVSMIGRFQARAVLLGGLAMLAAPLPGHAVTPAGCATTDPGGGSWPSLNHDNKGSRNQPLEDQIGTGNVTTLAPRWSFSTSGIPTGGTFEGTPVVADGCVFLEASAGDNGTVIALNADDGSLVWTHSESMPASGRLGGALVGSPVIDQGKVVLLVDQAGGPIAEALDEATGAVLWKTVYDTAAVSFTNASAVVWNGLVFAGIAGDEYQDGARGGFAILSESTGAILAHTYTIPDADFAYGYRGASVWSTAAVDASTGYAYVGTGNPGGCHEDSNGNCVSQARITHPNTDAIIKVDLNQADTSTFGQIVAVYRGTPDQYIDGLDRQPACQAAGNILYGTDAQLNPAPAWSVTCFQFDLDFGASPALFNDPTGRPVVGELQKSGVYHVVTRDTMAREWTATVGGPCYGCNAGTPGTDANGVYVEGTPGGQMFSFDPGGSLRWASPVADGLHYNATSTANGVAYTVDTAGDVVAFDTTTGAQLLRRPVAADVANAVAAVTSTGVAIARHTVYAAVDGYLVAYAPTMSVP